MTKTRALGIALALALGVGCSKQEQPAGPAPNATATPNAAGTGAATPTPTPTPNGTGTMATTPTTPTPTTPTPMPAGGDGFMPGEADDDFTLEEATAGLGKGTLVADITTPQGKITCELFTKETPKTVASFVGLARGLRAFKDPSTGTWMKGKYFDGLAFHRVIPDFMIQGGDPLSRDYTNPAIGTGGPGFSMPDETNPNLVFDKPGKLAMANSGSPTRAGSQFFITESPKDFLNGGYVIFGQCDGEDVVKTIARVPVDSPRHNKPNEPVTMSVVIRTK